MYRSIDRIIALAGRVVFACGRRTSTRSSPTVVVLALSFLLGATALPARGSAVLVETMVDLRVASGAVSPAHHNPTCQFVRRKAFLTEKDGFYRFLTHACDRMDALLSTTGPDSEARAFAELLLERLHEFEDAVARAQADTLTRHREIVNETLSLPHPREMMTSESAEFVLANAIGTIEAAALFLRAEIEARD